MQNTRMRTYGQLKLNIKERIITLVADYLA